MNMHQHTSQGFANLMGILIITVTGMSLALTLLSIDTGSTNELIAREAFAQARANANACTEDALRALREDDTYDGVRERTLTRGECSATTTSVLLGDGAREVSIASLGTLRDVLSHEEATLTISYPPPNALPAFSRIFWREVQ
jgi:hypothetical protein